MTLRSGFLLAAALAAGVIWTSGLHAQDGSNAWIDAARRATPERVSRVPMPSRRPRPPARPETASGETASVRPPLPKRAARAAKDATAPMPEEKPGEAREPVSAERAGEPDAPPAESGRPPPPAEAGPTWPHEAVAARALGRDIATSEEEAGAAGDAVAARDGEAPAAPPSGRRGTALAPLPVRKPPKPAARAPSTPPRGGGAETRSRPRSGSQSAKCAALGRCRDAFAQCKAAFIEKEGKWDLEKEPCGEEYRACVRQHFEPGEMFFTRWFWPFEACP